MRSPESLLTLDGVSVAFGSVAALIDVSFTVSAGEIVGIIGPNGAGKTSLFNCISGLSTPDAGTIRYDGIALDPVTDLGGIGALKRTEDVVLLRAEVLGIAAVKLRRGRRDGIDKRRLRRLRRVERDKGAAGAGSRGAGGVDRHDARLAAGREEEKA